MQRFEALIEDLLDVGRLETGLFEVDRSRSTSCTLVRETVDGIDAPNCETRVQAPRQAIANVDARRVRQALENLLSNALKHTPAGSATKVEVTPLERNGVAFVAILVRDEGNGVAPEMLPAPLQRFASGGPGGGLGLGLYMAHRIAAAHGGELTSADAPGQGAAFRMLLPAADALPD